MRPNNSRPTAQWALGPCLMAFLSPDACAADEGAAFREQLGIQFLPCSSAEGVCRCVGVCGWVGGWVSVCVIVFFCTGEEVQKWSKH
jgi:hypothetical protein